jgi:hypothetical protein
LARGVDEFVGGAGGGLEQDEFGGAEILNAMDVVGDLLTTANERRAVRPRRTSVEVGSARTTSCNASGSTVGFPPPTGGSVVETPKVRRGRILRPIRRNGVW